MRLGILGAGGWGKNLVRVFCELLGASAVSVVDPSEERQCEVASNHPGVRVSRSPDWAALDAAVIAAPAAMHFGLAREALDAGVHVLVEKPMTLSSSDARQLIQTAEMGNRVLMVDHLLEYHPAVIRLKALCNEGVLGSLLHFTSRRLNLGVVRSEENALWSLSPHDISIILYLLDQEPTVVRASGAAFLQPGIPDIAQISMEFPSGAMAQIQASWLDPIKTRMLSVVGDRAMAVYDDMAEEKLVVHHQRARREGARFVPERGKDEVIPLDAIEPLRSMAQEFLSCVETGRRPKADGQDGLRVVRVLEAAQASMDSGGLPVRWEKES